MTLSYRDPMEYEAEDLFRVDTRDFGFNESRLILDVLNRAYETIVDFAERDSQFETFVESLVSADLLTEDASYPFTGVDIVPLCANNQGWSDCLSMLYLFLVRMVDTDTTLPPFAPVFWDEDLDTRLKLPPEYYAFIGTGDEDGEPVGFDKKTNFKKICRNMAAVLQKMNTLKTPTDTVTFSPQWTGVRTHIRERGAGSAKRYVYEYEDRPVYGPDSKIYYPQANLYATWLNATSSYYTLVKQRFGIYHSRGTSFYEQYGCLPYNIGDVADRYAGYYGVTKFFHYHHPSFVKTTTQEDVWPMGFSSLTVNTYFDGPGKATDEKWLPMIAISVPEYLRKDTQTGRWNAGKEPDPAPGHGYHFIPLWTRRVTGVVSDGPEEALPFRVFATVLQAWKDGFYPEDLPTTLTLTINGETKSETINTFMPVASGYITVDLGVFDVKAGDEYEFTATIDIAKFNTMLEDGYSKGINSSRETFITEKQPLNATNTWLMENLTWKESQYPGYGQIVDHTARRCETREIYPGYAEEEDTKIYSYRHPLQPFRNPNFPDIVQIDGYRLFASIYAIPDED